MRRRAFTLVELLTVIAIISILYAIFLPVMMDVRKMAYRYTASNSIGKLATMTNMYAMDNDEAMPLAFYALADGNRQNWFGLTSPRGEIVGDGLLSPYIKGKLQVDATLDALPWAGDETGFGYNWGFLGSDYFQEGHTSDLRNCANAATISSLDEPADTISFGTSVFFNAPWFPHGDGKNYRYGFIDPPFGWFGSPTLDFRHTGLKTVDLEAKKVYSTGMALTLFVDGHVKGMKQREVKNNHFRRYKIESPTEE